MCVGVCGCGAVSLLSAAASGCAYTYSMFLCLSRIRHVVYRNAGRHLTKRRTEQQKKDARHLHIAEGNCLKRRKTKGISLHSDHDVVFQRRNTFLLHIQQSDATSPGGLIRVESIKYETNRRGDLQASTQWDTVARSMCHIVYISCAYLVCYANVPSNISRQPLLTPNPICAAIHLHAMQILLIKKLSQCHNQSNCLQQQQQQLKLSMQLHMSS